MDGHSIALLVVLIALIVFSAFFSAAEVAFSVFSRARMSILSQMNKRAKLVAELDEKLEKLLSAALIGKTILNVVSVAIATYLFTSVFQNIGIILAAAVMALVILAFGEVVPKNLVRQAPDSFALFSAKAMKFFLALFRPLVFLYSKLAHFMRKFVKLRDTHIVNDEELLKIVEEAEQDGGIDRGEGELIRNIIEFDDIAAIDIMTPRVDVIAVDKNTDNQAVADLFSETGYSRLPVYDETIDDILGLVHEKNFYANVWGTDKTIKDIIRPTEFIPPSMKISALLKLLQRNKVHLAVIVDEFGGTEGIITLEDILEELVGEIWDEHDEIEKDSFKRVGLNTFCVYSTAELDDFFEFFNIRAETDSSTINGWISEMLDKVPQVGDNFTFLELLNIRVIAVENNRVVELQVTGERIPDSAYDAEKDA